MTDAASVPNHIGYILDGNRRWAKQHGRPTLEGHRQGLETFKNIALASFDRGIKVVSAYVFSTENWQRTQEEVSYLMRLVVKGVEKHLTTFHKAGIRLVMLGSRDGLDAKILQTIDRAVQTTKDNTKGTLAICFNYGGQQEIVDAANAATAAGQPLTIQSLQANLYEPDLPAVDFVIRTSGEQRISNFMLWRAAYSELYFTDKLWPDFNEADLDQALAEYQQRQRRYGQ
ncbi:MAG: undecaprenyl diphosphate synthase [Patescibacteria group bacterium]|nr:undecaprenyl diphosphate synthase [Patescibacteria group bacterium]